MTTMSNAKRILLVEDEPGMAKVISKRLELAGFHVTLSTDGQDALVKARDGTPDLIILDLMLPKLNGYEICTLLKQDRRYQHIPIIMLTAKAQESDKKLGLECGADAYLTKPYRADMLLDQVWALLPSRPPAPRTQGPSPAPPGTA